MKFSKILFSVRPMTSNTISTMAEWKLNTMKKLQQGRLITSQRQ